MLDFDALDRRNELRHKASGQYLKAAWRAYRVTTIAS